MSEDKRLDLSNFLSPTIDRNFQSNPGQRYNSGYVANYQRDPPKDQSDSDSESSSGSSDSESGTASSSSGKSSDSPSASPIIDDTPKKKSAPKKVSHVSRTRTRVSPQNQPSLHNCVQEVFAIGHLPEDHTLVRGLPQLFNVSILRELTAEDPLLSILVKAARNKDYDKFAGAGKNLGQFYQLAKDEDGILLIDNRIAIPEKLRNACLNWLHRDHPGQVAMIDAANYLWWPKMHSQIVEKAEDCHHCKKTGKNMKPLLAKSDYDDIVEPVEANEEVQLDFAGPLFANSKSKTYLLVAVDSYSRFPSVAILKSTSTAKIIKFLQNYICMHGVPKNIKSDQYSGFKSKDLENFCNNTGINQRFCPVEDHRGCGIVERTIQTLKRRIATCLLD